MTRSPLTVTLSLFLLGIDSILNTLIFSGVRLGNPFKWQCDIGIVATVIGQFGFMMATGTRIFRISKVYNKYLSYIDNQKMELMRGSTDARTFSRPETITSSEPNGQFAGHEKKYADSISSAGLYSDIAFGVESKSHSGFNEMSDLKESRILLKGLLYFFLPGCIFGVLAMFYPSVYATFPVQESEGCVCSFFESQENGSHDYLIDLDGKTFKSLTRANSVMFYIVNWFGLLVLIWLLYGIRHTGDDTFLKVECIFLVSLWTFFSILQYSTFVFNYIISCENILGNLSQDELITKFKVSYSIVYWVIITRDFLCLLTMMIF